MTAKRVAIIVGSVRARRIGMDVARWVCDVGRESAAHRFEIVDLKDWPLPFDDEAGIPAHGG